MHLKLITIFFFIFFSLKKKKEKKRKVKERIITNDNAQFISYL
jgi:hypothetical protein